MNGWSKIVVIVGILVVLQFPLLKWLKHSQNKGAITLAWTKRLTLLGLTLICGLFVFFYRLPFCYTSTNYIEAVVVFFFIPIGLIHLIFWVIEEVRDAQWYSDNYRQQQGGSSRWGGEAVFRGNAMSTGWRKLRFGQILGSAEDRIFMGRSKRRFDHKPQNIGIFSKAHVLTLGMSGSGKSVCVLNNNLLTWRGPLFALDPKGELAAETIEQRRAYHSRLHILDPFEVKPLAGSSFNSFKCCYNPLDEVDINAKGAAGLIEAIADGCFIAPKGGKVDPFWGDSGYMILAGFIAHALTKLPKEDHTLPKVADLITRSSIDTLSDILDEMAENESFGGLPARTASLINQAAGETYGGIVAELQRSLKWTANEEMRESLSRSHFSLRELSDGEGCSLYVVLPFEYMNNKAQNRWMRVLTKLSFVLTQRAEVPPKPSVLFVIDEFPALGRFDSITDAFRQLRGAGIKLWLLAQDAAGLKEIYGEEWEGMAGNANIQILGIRCKTTAEWASKKLGNFIKDGKARPLMDPAEILIHLGEDSRNQIVFPTTGPPWQLDNVYYQSKYGYRGDPFFLQNWKRNH